MNRECQRLLLALIGCFGSRWWTLANAIRRTDVSTDCLSHVRLSGHDSFRKYDKKLFSYKSPTVPLILTKQYF